MGKGRPIYTYPPYNEDPDIAIGLLIPFNKSSKARKPSANYASGSTGGGSVFGQSYTTEEQSVSNLKNLLLTSKGERVMQPRFGCEIRRILFENNTIDIREELTETLTDDIEYWLPYISVEEVEVESSDDMHTIYIRVHFTITTIGANLVINIMATENTFEVSDTEVSELILTEIGTFTSNAGASLGTQY